MIEIGGYFGLELDEGKEYYPDLIRLNTGRNCLEYILRIRNYKKIFIPYFTCEVILEPLRKLHVNFEYYHIDEKLDPIFERVLEDKQSILVNNYFGIKNNSIRKLTGKYKNIIVDNSQAFYDLPVEGVDTFYSARKFFGVADGGYLSIDKILEQEFEIDESYSRMEHLLKRIDESATKGYKDFQQNNYNLINKPIKKMSKLTQRILDSIYYGKAKMKRERNFLFLHSQLKDLNSLEIEVSDLNAPMIYPFLCKKDGLKEKLINKKIYIPTYWSSVFDCVARDSVEYMMTKYLLPLPIDQRYGLNELREIVNNLLG